MSEKIVVVGSGLSGLIVANELQNAGFSVSVLEKNSRPGGLMNTKNSGVHYLHATKAAINYYKQYADEVAVRRVETGCYIDGKCSSYPRVLRKMTGQQRNNIIVQYYEKTRHRKASAVNMQKQKVMNAVYSRKQSSDYAIKNTNEIIAALSAGLNISYNTKVEHIDIEKMHIYSDKGTCEYDALVNTIPLSVFSSLSDINTHCEYEPLLFVEAVNSVEKHDYDWCYFPESSITFHRVSFVGKKLYIEATTESTIDRVLDDARNIFGSNVQLVSSRVLTPGHIIESSYTNGIIQELESLGVFSVGRYAQWKHNVKIDDVVVSREKLKRKIEKYIYE